MLTSDSAKKYREFYDQVRADTALDDETTIIVGLAAAMAAGCEP
ncbi:hypothetical protein [Geopsychrobacter electrodiphilus]|nr:hypothetical protein [Geopsychrobacter electrodiphilus]